MSAPPPRKRPIGRTGIYDGLAWDTLVKLYKISDASEIIKRTWWWRHQYVAPSLHVYLGMSPDKGLAACFAYEALARLNGRYPQEEPFNCLDQWQADNFAKSHKVAPVSRVGQAMVIEAYEPDRVLQHWGSLNADQKKALRVIEKEANQEYSEPFIIRFNLHKPAGSAATEIEKLIKSLQKKRGIAPPAKNKRFLSFAILESWDLRRWEEDTKGFKNLYRAIVAPAKIDPPGISKARAHAETIRAQFIQLSDLELEYIPFGTEGAFVRNSFWPETRSCRTSM